MLEGAVAVLIHNGGKEECVWRVGDPLELEVPCPVIFVNGKLQQHNLGRVVWLTPGKEQRCVEVLARGLIIEELIHRELRIEEASYKY